MKRNKKDIKKEKREKKRTERREEKEEITKVDREKEEKKEEISVMFEPSVAPRAAAAERVAPVLKTTVAAEEKLEDFLFTAPTKKEVERERPIYEIIRKGEEPPDYTTTADVERFEARETVETVPRPARFLRRTTLREMDHGEAGGYGEASGPSWSGGHPEEITKYEKIKEASAVTKFEPEFRSETPERRIKKYRKIA